MDMEKKEASPKKEAEKGGHMAHMHTTGRHGPGMAPVEKEHLVRRMARIEGQVKGIQRMVDEDAYCVDILVQISAVRAALQAVGMSIMDRHVRGCVTSAIKSENGDASIEELMEIIRRFSK